MTEDLELRIERLEVQVEGLIGSLHTLVESLAVAIGRDDVVPQDGAVPASVAEAEEARAVKLQRVPGGWSAQDVGHVLGERPNTDGPERY